MSVVTGMLLPGAVGHELTADWPRDRSQVDVEHPTGHLLVDVVVDADATPPRVVRSARRPHRPQALRRHRLPPPLTHPETSCPLCTTSPTSATSRSSRPSPTRACEFFTRYLGLTENGSAGDSVFLRAWDDYENVTIKLTAHATSGIGRTTLPRHEPRGAGAAGGRRSRRPAAASAGRTATPGTGRPTSSPTPTATSSASTTRAQWYRPPAELRPALKNQAQANPARGVSVRRLDHVNYLGVEVEPNRDYLRDTLGALVTEQIVLDDGSTAGSWTTFTNKGYDVVYTRDRTGTAGRLHHIAFATDTREDILRAADIALEQGVFIETGPHKHAIQQTFFLYVYEPGGNRIELCNAGARLVLAPDWQPIDWTEAERAKGQAWGLKTIASFHTHGTPPVEDPATPGAT